MKSCNAAVGYLKCVEDDVGELGVFYGVGKSFWLRYCHNFLFSTLGFNTAPRAPKCMRDCSNLELGSHIHILFC